MAAPQTKAASPYENYGCQCDRYTWVDTYGKIQGNCKSSDSTRGRWCYVQPGNTCGDIQYSKNRRDSYGRLRQWSYEACATPAPGYGGGNGCGNLRHGGGCGGGYYNNKPVCNNRPVVQLQASVNTKPITDKVKNILGGSSVKV